MDLKINGDSTFSRRRRTFALCQNSTQQPQTTMSRSANVGAFRLRKRAVRTLPGPLASASALRNHPEGILTPIDSGGKRSKTIRSEGLCRHGQTNRGHGQACVGEMVLAAPPRAPPSAPGSSPPKLTISHPSAFLTYDMIRLLQRRGSPAISDSRQGSTRLRLLPARLSRSSASATPRPGVRHPRRTAPPQPAAALQIALRAHFRFFSDGSISNLTLIPHCRAEGALSPSAKTRHSSLKRECPVSHLWAPLSAKRVECARPPDP